MIDPLTAQKAKADLEDLAKVIGAVAAVVPGAGIYAAAINAALILLAEAIGTAKPESPTDIAQAKKLNPLGMG